MLKELRLVSELTSQGQHWKRIPLSALLPLSHHMLFRLTWSDSIARSALFYVTVWFLMGDGCLYYIRAPVGWKSSKPYTGAQGLPVPSRKEGRGEQYGKIVGMKETPSSCYFNVWWYSWKTGAFNYILPLIFLAAFVCISILFQNVFEYDSWSWAPLKAFH